MTEFIHTDHGKKIKRILYEGYTVSFHRLTICYITNFHYNYELEEYRPGWQVSYTGEHGDICESFFSLNKAINRFGVLKGRFYAQGKNKRV